MIPFFDKLPRQHIFDALLNELLTIESISKREEAFHDKIIDLISRRKGSSWGTLSQVLYDKALRYNLGFKIPPANKIEQAIAKAKESRKRDEKPPYHPLEFVARITSKGFFINHGQQFYQWDGKIYQHLYDQEVDKLIITELQKDFNTEVYLSQVSEVRKLLAIDRFVRPEKVNKPGLITLQNGVLNLETGDFTEQHSPKNYSTIMANVRFDPNAECPKWLQLLTTALPENDQRLLLQEFIGYLLCTKPVYEKCLILTGDGANGKSTILEIIEHMLGPDNCSALSLDDLSERFRLEQLQGKLVNITYDNDGRRLLSNGKFKNIVSGEPQVIERKGKDPQKVRLFVKMIVACNTLPRTNDTSYGFARRLCIINFRVKFKDPDSVDPDNPYEKPKIIGINRDIIQNELSGVFNWAIQGFMKLQAQKKFTEPASSQEKLDDYLEDINPIAAYARDRLSYCEGAHLSLTSIYSDYQAWSKDNGIKFPVKKRTLSKHLESLKNNKGPFVKDRDQFGVFFKGVKFAA
ncbi:DNA primase family protein [Desulfomonile tiedjei]|uniref:Phage/plasmid primase, P4 family, C-terminal domain protein n=1 Tax=Desulfomonile tiedjei (strain ATCC 49306 / DSM 6799 / DCB-1) TaxID=706587 RepID=I4C601_DESTA|nr:phage/plasmid primase, P4 family [Desulfomonile tiedjei]AFM24992.1 phage/plasmid primase, P4 family, C-terminal domain protein [Desulfomonile tiedjei DSM 6799]